MGDSVGSLTFEAGAAEANDVPAADTPAARSSRWQFWLSPPDQPRWARPSLLVVAALAALSYGWGMADATLETFYGAAARSMSQSWHNFFFAAFDPWGTVSVDKLPGAFWVQALSVRIFGFHVWAVVLPQVVEGTLTVLVLYRAVRRVAGPAAGLAAAVALAATPVTILLNRGNISDSLLILLLVLAADATTAAFTTGRVRSLVVAGVWVGLAFQAKMLQAWLVLPALYLAYVLAAPAADLVRRLGHVAVSVLVVVVVSLSWMCVVSLVPAHDRPYVDASCDNSVFSQVFLYNGADRLTGNTLDQPGCNPAPAPVRPRPHAHAATVAVPTGPGPLPQRRLRPRRRLAAAARRPSPSVGILVTRRREPRTDALRAAAVLWAAWLFLTWSFFASSHFINSYYLAALAPPIAALCGMGLAVAWQLRDRRSVARRRRRHGRRQHRLRALPAAVRTPGYGRGSWPPPWSSLLAAVAVTARVAAAGARPSWTVPVPPWPCPPRRSSSARSGPRRTVVAARLGPFDSPYQPASITAHDRAANAESAAVIGAASCGPPHESPRR